MMETLCKYAIQNELNQYMGINSEYLPIDQFEKNQNDYNSNYCRPIYSDMSFDNIPLKHYRTISDKFNLYNTLEVIDSVEDKIQKKKAQNIISDIQDIINILIDAELDIGNLPELHSQLLDDGALLLEWLFYDYRIGFSVEKQVEESGWYLVSKDKHGNINSYGNFNGNEYNIIIWLILFIYLNK